MRKRYTVIKVNTDPATVASSAAWWLELRSREPEDVPEQLLRLRSSSAMETEKMSEDEGAGVLSWCASLQGWRAPNPMFDAMVQPSQRPLIGETVTDNEGSTESGAFYVYHVSQAIVPEAHNTRRGQYFFEPTLHGTEKPYCSTGFDTKEKALESAEAHERERMRAVL